MTMKTSIRAFLEKGLKKGLKGPERAWKGPETKADEMAVRSEAVLKALIADRRISRPKLASDQLTTNEESAELCRFLP